MAIISQLNYSAQPSENVPEHIQRVLTAFYKRNLGHLVIYGDNLDSANSAARIEGQVFTSYQNKNRNASGPFLTGKTRDIVSAFMEVNLYPSETPIGTHRRLRPNAIRTADIMHIEAAEAANALTARNRTLTRVSKAYDAAAHRGYIGNSHPKKAQYVTYMTEGEPVILTAFTHCNQDFRLMCHFGGGRRAIKAINTYLGQSTEDKRQCATIINKEPVLLTPENRML